MSLRDLIRAEIAASGPMRLDRYMALCLGHPRFGYYMRRDPFGAQGDFVTAPEISQVFGELIGLWAAQRWIDAGSPPGWRWIELGPGRGTLAADALRAVARVAPGFPAETWLVETSPALRAAQSARLPQARHVARLEDAPAGPAILVANEFFDALPIRQFHRAGGGWGERVVAREDDALRFALSPTTPPDLPDAPDGAVLERCAEGARIAALIGARIATQGGAALIVDYGAAPPPHGGGDTLQALMAHRRVDPLAEPGAADLTAHVDFVALARAAGEAGAHAAPLINQGEFLLALGLAPRLAALARANPGQADALEAAGRRLAEPAQMGALFKVLELG